MSITTSPSPNEAATHSFDRAVADLNSGVATATSAYTEMSKQAANTGSDFRAFNKGMVEAFVQVGQVLATELQNLFRDMAASSQAAATENLAGFRAVLSAKTVKEQLELQATLARTAAICSITVSQPFRPRQHRSDREGLRAARRARLPRRRQVHDDQGLTTRPGRAVTPGPDPKTARRDIRCDPRKSMAMSSSQSCRVASPTTSSQRRSTLMEWC